MGSKLSLNIEQEMIKRFISGESGASIGRSMGYYTTTVTRILKRNGQKMKSGKGEEHSGWKGGRGIKTGYWTVYIKDHPRKLNNGRVFEHILVAEKKLGRYISKEEPIHHLDFDRLNNDPNNLYVCKDNKDHGNVHASLEKIAKELFKRGIIKFNEGKYYICI